MGKCCQRYLTNKEIEIQLIPGSYDFKMPEQETEHRYSASWFNDNFDSIFPPSPDGFILIYVFNI